MKTTIKIIAGASLLYCVACGAKKSTQTKMEETQQEMATEGTEAGQGETSPEEAAKTDVTGKENTSVQTNNTSDEGSANDNTKDISSAPVTETADNRQLYTQLNMTDDQIQDFENAIEDFETRQQNMANGEMLGTVADEKDRLLEKILSPEQYSTYESLKKNN